MSQYKINLRKDNDWGWSLVDDNNEIIAHGGEGYRENRGVHEAIETVRREGPKAPVWEDESSADADSGYRFEIFSRKDDDWGWRFKSGNHQIMAMGEGYKTKSGVKRGIENIKLEMGRAEVSG